MLKVEIKNAMVFCPGSGMIVDVKGCDHCRYRKSATSTYVECAFDEVKYSAEWSVRR